MSFATGFQAVSKQPKTIPNIRNAVCIAGNVALKQQWNKLEWHFKRSGMELILVEMTAQKQQWNKLEWHSTACRDHLDAGSGGPDMLWNVIPPCSTAVSERSFCVPTANQCGKHLFHCCFQPTRNGSQHPAGSRVGLETAVEQVISGHVVLVSGELSLEYCF